MKPKHWKTRVPIYNSTLHVAVADTVPLANKMVGRRFRNIPPNAQMIGGCQHWHNHFALLFEHDSLVTYRHRLIAHEVFHLTHAIMEYHEQKFDNDNHESHALLHEWLTGWVYQKLKSVT